MKTNRKHKDSVFTALFSDPELLRELYGALGGVVLSKDAPVTINTLDNVLYMDLYNDISFEVGGKLIVLIEHQSSINPNMALRLLFYIAKVLEKSIEEKNIYSRKPLTLPWPEFYVLYNGLDPYPDEAVFRLSDLFENPQSLGLPEKHTPLLELEARVFNINEGRNEAVLSCCKKLAEYSAFISRIRSYTKELGSTETAIREAVKYCHRHGILGKFLEIHGSEVLNMLNWNMEDAIYYAREEGREEGLKDGRTEIIKNLFANGSSLEFIQKITGLSVEAINSLRQ